MQVNYFKSNHPEAKGKLLSFISKKKKKKDSLEDWIVNARIK